MVPSRFVECGPVCLRRPHFLREIRSNFRVAISNSSARRMCFGVNTHFPPWAFSSVTDHTPRRTESQNKCQFDAISRYIDRNATLFCPNLVNMTFKSTTLLWLSVLLGTFSTGLASGELRTSPRAERYHFRSFHFVAQGFVLSPGHTRLAVEAGRFR